MLSIIFSFCVSISSFLCINSSFFSNKIVLNFCFTKYLLNNMIANNKERANTPIKLFRITFCRLTSACSKAFSFSNNSLSFIKSEMFFSFFSDSYLVFISVICLVDASFKSVSFISEYNLL